MHERELKPNTIDGYRRFTYYFLEYLDNKKYTGLRAVDICGLKLSDIDWTHDCIKIIQAKTKRPINIPLSESIGNALIEYLLNERPRSDSDYVFLKSQAPFSPFISHSGIRNVLFNVVNDADIESKGRCYGTRISRHSTASRMLKKWYNTTSYL